MNNIIKSIAALLFVSILKVLSCSDIWKNNDKNNEVAHESAIIENKIELKPVPKVKNLASLDAASLESLHATYDLYHNNLFAYLYYSDCPKKEPFLHHIRNIFNCLYDSNSTMPMTQQGWRLSLIRAVKDSIPLSFTRTIFKKEFESNPPDFTDDFQDWLNTLELFSKNPSNAELAQLLNYSSSSDPNSHRRLHEDFIIIINEILSE